MSNLIGEVNKIIEKELWYDFEVMSFDGYTLVIVGGIDLYYNWVIKLIFINVSFVSLKADWKKNDDLDAIELIEGVKNIELKKLYFIDDTHLIFGLNHEDQNTENSNQYFISCEKLEYEINR